MFVKRFDLYVMITVEIILLSTDNNCTCLVSPDVKRRNIDSKT